MPSTFQSYSRIVSRGFDRSKPRHLVGPESCWDLLNLRQVLGRLEQTPWLSTWQNLIAINGESSTATRFIKLVKNVAGNLKYLVLNETNARFVDPTTPSTQTLIPCVLQVAKPNDATLTGECLLYGVNVTDFSAANDQIDVKTVSASQFQWRRNGGAWSSSLNIGPSVSIGINGLKVSFQGQGATTDYINFPTGSQWSWKRQDTIPTPTVDTTTFNFTFSSDSYQRDTYLGGINRNVMRVRDDFITSVGYSRVFGMHVAVFYNHLFVSQYAPGVYDAVSGIVDSYNSLTTPFTLGWSHLDNPDQMYNTLINEADKKQLPQQLFSELSDIGITGLAPWRTLLYIFLPDAIWSCQYVGLPNVMYLNPLNSNVGSIFRSGVVRTPQGIYFIGRGDVYRITSLEPESMGIKVRRKFFGEICPSTDNNFQRTFGFYNPYTKEVVWTYCLTASAPGIYQQRQMVYNEETDDWYFRNVPCASSGFSDVKCGAPLYNTFGQNLYGYNQTLYADQASGVSSGALQDTFTVSGGVATGAYTQPYFDTPFLDYGQPTTQVFTLPKNPFFIKQSDTMYIDASWGTGTSLQVYRAIKDLVGDGTVSLTKLGQDWTPTLPEARLSLPRDAYRQIAYRFLLNNGTNPVYNGIFNYYEEFAQGPQYQVER